VPVFLDLGGSGVEAERAQLRPLAQAALELGKAGEAGQARDVIPEPDGALRVRQPADDRAEERRAIWRAEMEDQRPDVLAGQRQRLVTLGAGLRIPPVSSSASARLAGKPADASSGPANARLPQVAAVQRGSTGESKISPLATSWNRPTAAGPRSARVRAATRSSRSPEV
jgi:hypothetical protein